MNCCFYLAIDRLPLGTVAAIEFLPVIVLAALGARTPRNALALLLAVPGVYLLTGVQLEGEPLGVALAFANAALFALYIVLAHRVAQLEALSGIDGLALSMLIALVVVTPLAGWAALPALADPVALLAGVGVGHLLLGDPVRERPARDAPAGALHLRADGLAAAGHRDRHRHHRARAGADARRDRGRRARDRRRRRAPRARGKRIACRPLMELNGIGALVAGGASGLGEATARELAARGARVAIADLNEERGAAARRGARRRCSPRPT